MIKDLKDLEKLLKLCRKQGVLELDLAGSVSFKLGDLPQPRQDQSQEEANSLADFPTDELSPEQLMYYASGGIPSEDPENKDF